LISRFANPLGFVSFRQSLVSTLTLVAGLMLAGSVLAQSQTDAAQTDASKLPGIGDDAPQPPERPLWEYGLAGIGVKQIAYPGSSYSVNRGLVVPYLIYRGEVVRAEGGGLGLRAVRQPRYQLDLGFSGSFGSGSDVPAREGMPNIGTLIEVGPVLKIRLGDLSRPGPWRIDLPLRGVLDVSDSFNYRGLSFEPQLVYKRWLTSDWRLRVTGGFLFGDRRLSSTFYGVDPQFATATRSAYRAKSGLIATRLLTSLSYRITRYLSITGFARYDSVAGAANRASPLVERNGGLTYGLNMSWTIGESTERAVK
jgi:hypothetical protein